jgi:hypothetical protein
MPAVDLGGGVLAAGAAAGAAALELVSVDFDPPPVLPQLATSTVAASADNTCRRREALDISGFLDMNSSLVGGLKTG